MDNCHSVIDDCVDILPGDGIPASTNNLGPLIGIFKSFSVGTETVACCPTRIEKKTMPVALRRFFEQHGEQK